MAEPGVPAEAEGAVDQHLVAADRDIGADLEVGPAQLVLDLLVALRLFRRLGLHPGADIDAYAASALDGTGLAVARRGLEALYDQYLLTEPAQGRYRMHDLLRAHARALADRLDPGSDRAQATERLLDYYRHTANLADALLARQTRTTPAPVAALAWARAERASLLACLDDATRTAQHARIIALTAGVAALLRHDGPWAEALKRHATALRSAQHLGDRLGQASALTSLGIARLATGDYPGATRDLEEAPGIHRDLSDRLGQALALNNLGIVRQVTGDYPGATRDLEEALGIHRDLGDRGGEAEALNEAGTMHRVGGDLRQAGSYHQQALDLASQIGSSWDEPHALAGLGRCALAAGHTAEAEDRLRQALQIFQQIGAAEAAEVPPNSELLPTRGRLRTGHDFRRMRGLDPGGPRGGHATGTAPLATGLAKLSG